MMVRKIRLTKLVALALGMIVVLPTSIKASSVSTLPPGNWTLLPMASDEFDGDELDHAKWDIGIWYDVTTDLAFKDENVSVRDGKLVLVSRKEDYNGKAYTAAAVESKFEVPGTDSYVEVRAKALNKEANVLSAIWLQSSPLSKAMNPNPEIDIMETFDYRKMASTLHTWRQDPAMHFQVGENSWNTGLSDISKDYHIYGLERRNGMLRFYFDGQLVWEKKPIHDSFVELSRHMVLSLEGHLGKPVAEHLPEEFLIDYVRTYYDSDFEGIPDDGIYQLINRNSGKVLGVPNTTGKDKKQLVQSENNDKDSTMWKLTHLGDGIYTMENMANKEYMDLTGDKDVTSNGNPIISYEYHGTPNQRWHVIPTNNGYFRIMSALSGKAICVKDASLQENANIIQWTFEGPDTNDEWIFVKP